MSHIVKTVRATCPDCETSLPVNAPDGLCPACLLKAALGTAFELAEPDDASPTEQQYVDLTPNAQLEKTHHQHPAFSADECEVPPREFAVTSNGGIVKFCNYELLEEIGSGGMGVVYRARQIRLNRQVALKMIRAGRFSSETEIQRLRVEAQAAAQLDHPGIVPVFEVSEHEGLHFFTMALVDGQTLSAKLNDGPLPIREAASIMQSVAEAVAYAHSKGVIHRDIKPGNILIDRTGQPRVSDFGLAKQISIDSELTTTGQILGTPSYMPPEQALGKVHEIGELADVYSLGAVLYATLTGRPPFQAQTSVETLRLVVDQLPLAPRLLNPSVPKDLETICLKCLEKSPSRRYLAARDLADELQRFLNGEPILAQPAGPMRRVVQWYRRHRTAAAISASVLLMFIGVSAVSSFAWIRELSFREELQKQQAETKEALGRSQDSLSDIHAVGGVSASLQGNHADAALWFATAATLSAPDSQRTSSNLQRSHLESLAAPLPLAAVVHPEPWVMDVLFSPSGKHLLTSSPPAARFEGKCCLWDSRTGAEVKVPQLTGNLTAAAWSPDGSLIAAGSDTGVLTLQNDPEGPRLHMLRLKERIDIVRFDAAGQYLAVVYGVRRKTDEDDTNAVYGIRLQVFNVADLTPATPVLRQPGNITTIAFSPDGKQIVVANDSGTFQVHPIPSESGQPVSPTLPCWTYGVSVQIGQSPPRPVFLNEGRELLIGYDAWDTSTWQKSARSFGYRDPNAVTLSPDGTRVLASHFEGLGIYSVATGHSHLVRFLRKRTFAFDAELSPDGKYVIRGGSDSQVELLSFPDFTPVCGAMAHAGTVPAVAWAPDGKRFATAQRGGLVRVWSMPSKAAETTTLPGIGLVAMSLDGRFVASRGTSHRDYGPTSTRVYSTTDGKAVGPPLHFNGIVRNAVFSPKQDELAVATGDPWTVVIRNWRDATDSRPPRAMPSEPRGIDFSPDGNTVAVLCAGGEMVLLDSSTGEARTQWTNEIEHFSALQYVDNGAIAFSPDGQQLLTFQTDSRVRVWEAQTGKLRYRTDGHTERITAIAFSPDGRQFATGSRDNTARVWDLANGQATSKPMVHSNAVLTLCFHPEGRFLATGGFDGEARVWDWMANVETGSTMSHPHSVRGIQFFRGGHLLATVSEDGFLQIWDESRVPIMTPVQTFDRVMDLKLTPNGTRAVVGGFDSPLTLVSLDRCNDLTRLSPKDSQLECELISGKRIGNGASVSILSANDWLSRWKEISPVHSAVIDELVTIQGQRQFVRHSMLNYGLSNLEFRPVTSHSGPVSAVAISPDGRHVLSTGTQQTEPGTPSGDSPDSHSAESQENSFHVRVTDMESGKTTNRFTGPTRSVRDLAISDDGRRVAGISDDGFAYVWSFEDGLLVNRFQTADRPIAICPSPDGEHVVIACEAGIVQYWNVSSAKCISEIAMENCGPVKALSISPDGSQIVVAEKATLRRFNVPELHELEPFAESRANVIAVKWSPTGQTIASATEDHSWTLWDVESRLPMHTFPSHADNQYRSIAWAGDGSKVALGGSDGLIQIYSMANLEFPALLRQHEGAVNCLAFLPDRTAIVSAGYDQSVRIWPVTDAPVKEHSGATLISSRFQSLPNQSATTTLLPATKLDIVGISDGVRLERQDLGSFGGHFPTPMHLLVFGGRTGDFVEVAIPVPSSGKVRLTLQLTQSYDFGIVGFKVNDQTIERQFDAYSFFVTPSPLLDLGEFEVDGTPLRLRTEVTGTNRRSKAPGYYFGIAAVVVERLDNPSLPAATESATPPSDATQ